MSKRWEMVTSGNQETIEGLSTLLNIDNKLSSLLVQRGIVDFEGAKSFFRPNIENLHDPFLMKDMNLAVARLDKALLSNEKILIYGDYDVDGTTAVALVYSFLKEFYSNIDFYIPDRYAEGYGISFQGIDFAKTNGFSLIIALDCGIKSTDKVHYANDKNIDFIICDHHLPGSEMPAAVAVLDPKRDDCQYPYKELSGCGIGFKLIHAYSLFKEIPFDNIAQFLDLAAISIAADIVPITGENRILAYHGLKRINDKPRPGIKAILELNNLKKELSITDVVFTIAPRINAAGRISSGNNAVELLISDSFENALASGVIINQNNLERKGLDVEITQHALEIIGNNAELINKKTTVLYSSSWHKGVIGIVASRLIETYYRPTILLTESNGKATGSARSVKGFDVYNAIEECVDLLEQFGGHKYAAGLTMKIENVDEFIGKFEEIVSRTIPENLLIPQIEIDLNLNLREINDKFNRILKQFAPFGPENMSPVFVTYGVKDKGNARIVGNNHLKMDIIDSVNPKASFSAIGFNLGQHLSLISNGNPFNIVYSLEENEWNGKVSLQLNIKDIKFD